jgi:molybdenum cofactor cytidylyltransferase
MNDSPAGRDGLPAGIVVGAVLLAAGRGARLGDRPKALLEYGGIPLVRRQLSALSGSGVTELVVVLGHYHDQMLPWVRDFSATIVRNTTPDSGQPSSLRLGLAALSTRIDAVLVALADQPLIGSQDIRALIEAFITRPEKTDLVQPCVDGEPGNPVMFTATVRNEILASAPDVGGREWQMANRHRVYRWGTPNVNYRTDIDRPEDLETFARRTGNRLTWPAGHEGD